MCVVLESWRPSYFLFRSTDTIPKMIEISPKTNNPLLVYSTSAQPSDLTCEGKDIVINSATASIATPAQHRCLPLMPSPVW